MLKQSPLIDELCVYDVLPTCGFALELAHVDTKCKVSAYSGSETINMALQVYGNITLDVLLIADRLVERQGCGGSCCSSKVFRVVLQRTI